MERRPKTLLALTALVIATSCSTNSPSSFPPPTIVRFESSSGVFESPFPATVQATLGETVSLYDFAISAGKGTDYWGATVSLSRDNVIAGHVDVPIAPVGDGTAARVELSGIVGDSGTFSFTLGPGTITGTVSASPTTLNGSFSGQLSALCYVPKALLPNHVSAGGTDAPGALVLDENLETDPCALMRPWRAR
jgi:hypothetical protein